MTGLAVARSEATRATYDPTCGRYTWGKLEIMSLRDQARTAKILREAKIHRGKPPGAVTAELGADNEKDGVTLLG